MDRRGRRVMLLTLAALAGAAVAFPAGLYFARPIAPAAPPRPRTGSASLRNHYAPDILSDPHFIDQQRRVVEMLEASCRSSGEHCREAAAARARLTALETGA
jgi:hypothetical protein